MTLENIILNLKSKKTEILIETLKNIPVLEANKISNLISELTYHYHPEVRTLAYLALCGVEGNLTQIIKDGLKDNNKEAFKAATILFHFNDKKLKQA